MKQNMKTFFTLLIVILCFFSHNVNAQTAAVQTTNTPREVMISEQFPFGNNLGWSFTVGSNSLTLSALGLYDAGGDGFAESHPIGPWTSTGILVASTHVSFGTVAPLIDGYRYGSITPSLLNAGQTYVIGAWYQQNSADAYIINSTQTFAPYITFGESQQPSSNPSTPPFGFPGGSSGTHNEGYFGPNFQFVAPPDLSINDVTQNEGNNGQTSFTFTVSLSGPADYAGVSFNLATSDGTTNPATQPSDYTAVSGPYYIPEGSSELTVSVLVNGDNDVEPDETFLAKISNVTGARVIDGEGLGTILNDDVFNPCADITPISCATPTTFSLSGSGIWNTANCAYTTYGKEKIYSFTATTTGRHQIQVTAFSDGFTDYFFKAASGGCSSTGWTCINDSSPFGPLTAGVTYYILVDPERTIDITETFQINCPVDPCLSIPTISCETPVTSNHSGPGAWNVTACGSNTPGQEKVYSFTAVVTGIYNLEITPTSGTYYIDYFYKAASDGCDATDWNCIGTTGSATSFSIGTLTGGTTYYILLKSHGAAYTSHTFKINCPVVATASVGDRLWNDTDADGAQDGGETGLNGITVELKNGGGTVIATTTTAGDGNYLFFNLAAGAYSVVVVSATLPAGYTPTYDLDGTATPHGAAVTLTTAQVRTDADFGYSRPSVTCPADITVNSSPILCGAFVTYHPVTSPSGSCGGAVTYSKPSGSWFPVGTTTVTVTTTCGTSCSFKITVKDVQKPVILCPSDITVNALSNSCSKSVTFNLTVADNCPGATITTSPASGSVFNVGTTTVTATATDASGNKTTSTFTVKVKESQPPVIKVVATPIVLLWPANGSYQTINVSQCVLSVTDNCSSIPVSSVKITKVTSDESENASGDADGNTTKDIKIASDCKSVDLRRERKSTGNGRVYTIYLSVTDASGNTSSATFKVIAPVSQTGTTAVCDATAYTVNSNCSGNSYRSAAGITTTEEEIVSNEIPEEFMMEQNYPNPFSTVTIIRYALPVEAKVSLGVYNQLGQRVAQLTEGKMSAGNHQARFDATKLAGGIYLYRLVAVDADGKPVVLTKKMIVAK